MKKLIFLLIFTLKIWGFDLFALQKAKYYESHKQYEKCAIEYLKLNSQKALYNAANCYYRAKKYKKAVEIYKKITSKDLQFRKFYNMGNAYALNHQFKKAIEAYKKALKIKKDKDAEYNLKLIKKLLKKQPPPPAKSNKNKKNDKKKSKNQNKTKTKQKKNKSQKQNNQTKHVKSTSKLIKKPVKSQQKKKKTDDIRAKYYERELKSLEFNTLLLPLKGDK